MIALTVLVVICTFISAFISWIFDLNSKDTGILMSWCSALLISALLVYLGCF